LGAGIPRVIDQAVSVLPYGHPAAFDLIRRQRHELAAVLVEPVRGNDPHLDAGPWLNELAAVRRQAGVLFILDESITGFRVAFGGAQEVFGLRPDLAVYGKAVGGGLPLGIVAGQADVMRIFTAEAGTRAIFAASTFAGNPLSIAAGLAALTHAATNRHQLYADLEKHTALLSDGVRAIARELDMPAQIARAGSIFKIVLEPRSARRRTAGDAAHMEETFAALVLRHGVLMQAGLRGYLSGAHTSADVTRLLVALQTSLRELKAGGAMGRGY
jgi:glutamate-1-semialdehyde aminotransferase